METIDMTRDEMKTTLSILISRREVICKETDELQREYGGVTSLIHALNDVLTGTEPKTPAELVDLDWQVGDDRDKLNRLNRAIQEEVEINKLSDDLYQVVNGKGRIFIVSIAGQKGSCTCMDFQKRGQHRAMPCKHLYAIGMHNGDQTLPVEPEQPVNQSDEPAKCINCGVAVTSGEAQGLDDMCQRCWLQKQGTGNGVPVNAGGSDE